MEERPIRTIIGEAETRFPPAPKTTVGRRGEADERPTASARLLVTKEAGRLRRHLTNRAATRLFPRARRGAATRRRPTCPGHDAESAHHLRPTGRFGAPRSHLIVRGEFRTLPVVENGQPLGMVSRRDALVRICSGFVGRFSVCATT